MYRCPQCWQDFLTQFDPCPGCSEHQTRKTRSQRARERRLSFDPVCQIEQAEFWALWRLYAVCPCCGEHWGQRDHISKDHIVPLARGGPNIGDNLQPLCQRCNLWKSDHIIYFDRAFMGRVAPLPEHLWCHLPPAPPPAQMTLLALEPDRYARFPQATPQELEQLTCYLTREAQQESATPV